MKVANQKSLFTIPGNVVYLNCAYMSPGLKSIQEAGIRAVRQRTKPWTLRVQDWFEPAEELKMLFASLINADKKNIALVPSVSYGIAVAKQNIHLNATQEIVLLDQEYPSNIYAWRELSKETGAQIITVRKEENQSWTEAILARIHKKTGLVAIPNCHWTNGGLVDLKRISRRTKAVGSKLVLDASQSLGAYPLDIQAIRPDFLVTAGYKWLLGPYGLSYLYADEKYFKKGKPIEYTWIGKKGSEDFTRLVDYTEDYKEGASRFDAGESSAFINIPMAKAALTQVLEWGVENIRETLSGLTTKIERAARKQGYKISDTTRVDHMLGILPGENKSDSYQIEQIKKRLSDHKIYISFRGPGMRIAPYLYNDPSDLDKLFKFL